MCKGSQRTLVLNLKGALVPPTGHLTGPCLPLLVIKSILEAGPHQQASEVLATGPVTVPPSLTQGAIEPSRS